MLVALVVVDVPGEKHDPIASVCLPVFEHLCKRLLTRTNGMPSSQFLLVGGTRVRRMVIHDEDEVYVCWNVIKFARHPLTLRTSNLVKGTVEDKHQHVGDPHRVEAAAFQIWEPLKVVA